MPWTLVVTLNFKDYIDHLLDGDLNEKEEQKKDRWTRKQSYKLCNLHKEVGNFVISWMKLQCTIFYLKLVTVQNIFIIKAMALLTK